MTTALERFFDVYDEEQVIERIVKANQKEGYVGRYPRMTADQLRERFRNSGPMGSERHAAYEALLTGRPLTEQQTALLEHVAGFRLFLTHRTSWRVLWTERRLYHTTARIAGSADVRFVEALGDWKNCGYNTLVPGQTTLALLLELGILVPPGRLYSHPEEEEREVAAARAYDRAMAARQERRKEIRREEAMARKKWALALFRPASSSSPPQPMSEAEVEAMLGPKPRPPAEYAYHDAKTDKVWSYCPHPLMAHLPSMKIVKYACQVNGYDYMEEAGDGDGGQRPKYACEVDGEDCVEEVGDGDGRQRPPLVIVNFPPERPHAYEMFFIARQRGLTQRLFSLFPWRDEDERHLSCHPERDLLVRRLSGPSDVRGQGPTTVRRVRPGPIPPGFVWMEGAYDGRGYALPLSHWALEPTYRVHKPYPFKSAGQREAYVEKLAVALRRYEAWLLMSRERLEELVPHLHGRTLLCWCNEDDEEVTRYCHARLLARYANALASGTLTIRPKGDSTM